MQSSESSGGNLRLSTSCSAPSFRTYGRHATKVYGRGSRHCYAIIYLASTPAAREPSFQAVGLRLVLQRPIAEGLGRNPFQGADMGQTNERRRDFLKGLSVLAGAASAPALA